METNRFVVKHRVAQKALVTALSLTLIPSTFAADTTTQTATFEVQAINEISVSGTPNAMTINSATAGSEPDAVTATNTTWALTTNETNKKITAAIDSNMPDGTTLTVNMTAPSTGTAPGTSEGAKVLSTVATDVVTAITEVAESGMGITYELSATVAAGVVASAQRTVTFTITDGGA